MISLLLLIGLGCSEYTVSDPPKVPPAEPPGAETDDLGEAPDWANCYEGFQGTYANLDLSHPDVLPEEDAPPPESPDELDWWDDRVFSRFDPSLDFGTEWWPVDEDLEGDPDFFAVRWVAWVRARDDRFTAVVGGADDVWIRLNRELVYSRPGVGDFEPERVAFEAQNAQVPIEIFFAHRGSDTAGFRFRVVEGDVTICIPDYGDDE